MNTHKWRWVMGWFAAYVLGMAVARAETNAVPAAPSPEATGSEQGTDDFQFILDRIREIEKNHVQREIEMERLRAKKAELEAELEKKKEHLRELEQRQAALQVQAHAMEPSAPAPEPSGWYLTLAPVELQPHLPATTPKKIPSGQYLRVIGRSPAAAWRVQLEGTEYDAAPVDNLVEDSVMRGRLEARREDCIRKGDQARAEQITQVLEHLREQLRTAASAQVLPAEPPPKPAPDPGK